MCQVTHCRKSCYTGTTFQGVHTTPQVINQVEIFQFLTPLLQSGITGIEYFAAFFQQGLEQFIFHIN